MLLDLNVNCEMSRGITMAAILTLKIGYFEENKMMHYVPWVLNYSFHDAHNLFCRYPM